MSNETPVIYWLRRDLRLSDHPGLAHVAASGRPVIPVFILDPETEALGAAAKWRLGLAVASFRDRLRAIGSDLVLRRGTARETIEELIGESGAEAVHWTRLYTPEAVARDSGVKSALKARRIEAASHPGHLVFEPWSVETGAGGHYKVYSPFWRAVSQLGADSPVDAVRQLRSPEKWPESDLIGNWGLGLAMNRGSNVVGRFVRVGEVAALDRLDWFLAQAIDDYKLNRDRPDLDATSRLSENLTYGEISARTMWHAALRAKESGSPGAEHFMREIAWRDFAWHLIWHTPHIAESNWRPDWDAFPWRNDNPDAERWRRGLTGESMIDAGMREMYVTGTMHNRVRMLVASYLTKHLMTHWKVGLDWFAECLTDWDPASNAMGWQWAAGSGPDAAPYFRVFNPETQGEKFDPEGRYRHRFLHGFGPDRPHADAIAYFDAVPKSWDLGPEAPLPSPMIELAEGRKRALAAHSAFSEARQAEDA